MFFKIDQQLEILQIDDTYATLSNIREDGSLEFKFQYSIKQSDAIKNQATKVDVTVFTRSVKRSPIGTSTTGRIDAKELIDNILSISTATKSAIKSQDSYVLARKSSDVSAYINNDAIKELKNNCSIKNIQSLYHSKLKAVPSGELRVNNDKKPVLHMLNTSHASQRLMSAQEDNTRVLSHDLILRQGIDPSEISTLSPKVLHTTEAFQGTLYATGRRVPGESPLQRLHDNLVLQSDAAQEPELTSSDVDDSRLLDVVVNEADDTLTIPISVRFAVPDKKMTSRDSTDVFVRFDLLNVNSAGPIYSTTKVLPIAQHIRKYLTPIEPPVVRQANSEASSRANLELKQIDKTADSVFLYKKNLYTSSVDVDSYALVGTYKTQGKQAITVQVDRPVYGAAIYRCVPAYRGVLGYSYTNVVVRPKKYRPVSSLSLTSVIVDGAVLLEARNLPPTAVSLQFMQRNRTTHEEEFTPIGTPLLIDETTRYADYLSTLTFNVLEGNVYEFTTKVIHRTGLDEMLESEIIEYIPKQAGRVDIRATNVIVSHEGEPNVTFDVSIKVVDNNIDAIKDILERQGIKVYFEDDIARQREQLKNMLVYSVHRVNETTGERENLGVVTQDKFSDKEIRKKVAAKSLKYGQKYRYIISALARAPETALESFVKVTTDLITKKRYSYKPSKFLHPIALKRGVLTTPAGLLTRYTKSTFEHGALGVDTTVEVTFDREPVNLVEASVSTFDSHSNIISWKVQGDARMIDHFVIMKEVHGTREIVGCAHNLFSQGNCQWIHKLTGTDRGQLRYIIAPMMDDYKRGQEVTTNTILIEGTWER